MPFGRDVAGLEPARHYDVETIGIGTRAFYPVLVAETLHVHEEMFGHDGCLELAARRVALQYGTEAGDVRPREVVTTREVHLRHPFEDLTSACQGVGLVGRPSPCLDGYLEALEVRLDVDVPGREHVLHVHQDLFRDDDEEGDGV